MTSYCRNIFGPYVSPVILILISIFIGIFPLYIFWSEKTEPVITFSPIRNKYSFYAIGTLLGFLLLFLFVPRGGIINIYKCYLVDSHFSDIIPTIQVMCRRLLSHQPIYVPIEEFGYHLSATYLPFMWLPYTLAEKFHFDYRWITLAIWCMTIIVIIFATIKSKSGVFVFLLYGLLLLTLTEKNSEILGWSVETMNGAYYSILALSFFSKNKYLKTFGLGICLLSRYSVVLFIPLYFIVEWYNNGIKKTFVFALLLLVFLSVFLIPLVKNNWIELYNGYKYYGKSGLGAWTNLDASGLKVNIFNGNGFTSWIYSFKDGSIEERFAFAKSLHLILVSSTTVLLAAVYYKFKNKVHYKLYLLCGLKIYLAVFYGFIQVPYYYLFVVPVMYSLAMLLIVNNLHHNKGRQFESE